MHNPMGISQVAFNSAPLNRLAQMCGANRGRRAVHAAQNTFPYAGDHACLDQL